MNPLHFPGSYVPSPGGNIAANRARLAAARAKSKSVPPVLHEVATVLGKDVAAGVEPYREALAALAMVCLHHPLVGVERYDDVFPAALRVMDRYTVSDEAQAAQDIRLGLIPLLDRRRPSAELRAAAYALSAARLLRPDCDAIVREETAKRLARPRVSGVHQFRSAGNAR